VLAVCIVSKIGSIVTTRQGKDKEVICFDYIYSVNKGGHTEDKMDSMDKSEMNLDDAWESVAKSFLPTTRKPKKLDLLKNVVSLPLS